MILLGVLVFFLKTEIGSPVFTVTTIDVAVRSRSWITMVFMVSIVDTTSLTKKGGL